MKELLREREVFRISYFQSLLEAAGIETFIKNKDLSTLEVSIPVFFPALCVVNDTDYNTALKIIKEDMLRSENASTEEIMCDSCNEKSPASFDTCWNCQKELHSCERDHK